MEYHEHESHEGRDDDQPFHIDYFSDDDDDAGGAEHDKYHTINSLIINGKKSLRSGGNILIFKRNLVQEIHTLGDVLPIWNGSARADPTQLDPENEMQTVVLDNWIEEVLRFLALKTITGDITEPCQLLPGHAVGVGWKILMMTPSLYSKVCLAMGNQNIFDHNPCDTAASKVQIKHKVKRHNATLRAYERYFDQQPPALYWSFHKKEAPTDDSVISLLGNFCGLDTSFITDPFADDPSKKEPGMSPVMPPLSS